MLINLDLGVSLDLEVKNYLKKILFIVLRIVY